MIINQRILISCKGIIAAPFGQVRDKLIEAPVIGRVNAKDLPFILSGLAGEAGSLVIKGGPVKYGVYTGQDTSLLRVVYMDVDRSKNMLAYYGGWWFLNEYEILPHEKGCLVKNNVVNIAPGLSRVLLPFSKEFRSMFREDVNSTWKHSFQVFLENVASQLSCESYVI
jgi:hypothetical protein